MIYINTLFAVLGAIVVGVLADGGYSLNCRNMSLVNLNQKHLGLRAYCDTTTGTPQCSILDLDLCYRTKGNDLKLDPMDNGKLSSNCSMDTCSLGGGGYSATQLHCRCRHDTRRHKHSPSSTDTNALMSNDNGFLKCFDNNATFESDCTQKPAVRRGSGNRYPVPSWTLIFLFGPLYLAFFYGAGW
ncbi:hypothetical protein F4821DRAFT_245541 [Hypoxylon rubiginosum]|uniref:Uncharacterized protein n=1 Tax=Hypoxylon rubiginosum TaxID=110542 RepID=A0ACC0CSJ1_9PEZI|nr:hypothetical protein F4821DRAFT_245541 [Hypoxylon rubiginosum]